MKRSCQSCLFWIEGREEEKANPNSFIHNHCDRGCHIDWTNPESCPLWQKADPCEVKYRRLKTTILKCINTIDAGTKGYMIEPKWWLEMMELKKLISK